MTKSISLKVLSIVIVLALFAGCNDDEDAISKPTYIRVINTSAVYNLFYLDGHVNGNANKSDSLDFIKGGYRFGEDTILFPPPRFIDVKKLTTSGVYQGSSPEAPCYFPTSTTIVDVAPIIGDIDFYKWASFPSGNHEVEFKDVTGNPRNQKTSPGKTLAAKKLYFESESVYTLFVAKTDTGRVDYDVLSIKEPTKLSFDSDKAYIRFLNFSTKTANASFNNISEAIDIYFTKSVRSKSTLALVESDKVLVRKNLQRFNVDQENMDFFEIDMSDLLKLPVDGLTQLGSNSTAPVYTFYFYRTGESAEKGNLPLGKVNSDYNGGISPLYVIDPLRAQTTITTVLINISPNPLYLILPVPEYFASIDAISYNLENVHSNDSYFK